MKKMNNYYKLLKKIVEKGNIQKNKKGDIKYLLNQSLKFSSNKLKALFIEHKVAKKLLQEELALYLNGETSTSSYNNKGIFWWDYCSPTLINSYPSYFCKLPKLIEKINAEKKPSKNYVLFIGEAGVETNQPPCLSLIHFQIGNNKLVITVYQRSADCSLGLPSDLYHIYLISTLIDIPLKQVVFFIGNAHIYSNNIEETKKLLNGLPYKYTLNT